MPDVYEIVKAIKQIEADASDHPYGGTKTGVLEREGGHLVNDPRVIDGFSIKIGGNMLQLCYSSEMKMKEAHQKDFETDLETTIEALASFVKKEYKKMTGNALTLTGEGEMDAIIQETSRVRCWVKAYKIYKIGGIYEQPDARVDRKKRYDAIDRMLAEEYKPELAWRRFLDED